MFRCPFFHPYLVNEEKKIILILEIKKCINVNDAFDIKKKKIFYILMYYIILLC